MRPRHDLDENADFLLGMVNHCIFIIGIMPVLAGAVTMMLLIVILVRVFLMLQAVAILIISAYILVFWPSRSLCFNFAGIWRYFGNYSYL